MQKTKVMCNSLGREQRFAIGGEALEFVKEYVYSGQLVTAEPNHETEVTRRIRMEWSTFGKHSQMINGSLPLSLKRKVYRVFPEMCPTFSKNQENAISDCCLQN